MGLHPNSMRGLEFAEGDRVLYRVQRHCIPKRVDFFFLSALATASAFSRYTRERPNVKSVAIYSKSGGGSCHTLNIQSQQMVAVFVLPLRFNQVDTDEPVIKGSADLNGS